jgi:hypothetical protein
MDWKRVSSKKTGEPLSSRENDSCFYDKIPVFVAVHGVLPIECMECYKVIIFWKYSRDNVTHLKWMMNALPVYVFGKYNEDVVVFYFKSKPNMLTFIDILSKGMIEYEVMGIAQWRVSGHYWQKEYPHLFKSAKELVPVAKPISIKAWMKNNDT